MFSIRAGTAVLPVRTDTGATVRYTGTGASVPVYRNALWKSYNWSGSV